MSSREGKNRFAQFEDDGGGEWIASYADLMSLLLGFFIILYSFSQISEKQMQSMAQEVSKTFKGKVKEEVKSESDVGMTSEQRQLRALEMLISLTEIAPNVDAAVEKIEQMHSLKEHNKTAQQETKQLQIASKRLLVLSGRDNEALLEMVLPANLIFKTKSTILKKQAYKDLKKVAQAILRIEDLVTVKIVGHTDSRPEERKGVYRDHWALSAARAGSVAQALIKYGVNPLTLDVEGRAFYQPLFEEYTTYGEPILENMQRNRRVHIKVYRKATLSQNKSPAKQIKQQGAKNK